MDNRIFIFKVNTNQTLETDRLQLTIIKERRKSRCYKQLATEAHYRVSIGA